MLGARCITVRARQVPCRHRGNFGTVTCMTKHAKPFPRTPDGLPNAWTGDDGRFTPGYEARAEAVWDAVIAAGYTPSITYAGSEDGEALLICGEDGELQMLLHLEDPAEQEAIDRAIADGSLQRFVTPQHHRRTKR